MHLPQPPSSILDHGPHFLDNEFDNDFDNDSDIEFDNDVDNDSDNYMETCSTQDAVVTSTMLTC